MKLFLLSQEQNNGYDTYDACVVVAHDANDARTIHPWQREEGQLRRISPDDNLWSDWITDPSYVNVTYLGEAAPNYTSPGVICASFNAG